MPVNQIKRNGSYAPLSATYYTDDALMLAGDKAEVLFTRGLAFCAATLSDGLITDLQVSRVIGAGLSNPKGRAARLVEVGLWERIEDDALFGSESKGYRVRSWAKWNLTKSEIQEKQRRDADRKAEGKK